MRIIADTIRYRDYYKVYKKGESTIRIEWICDGNVSFPANEPYEVRVCGWPSYAGDSVMDDKIATAEMVLKTIVRHSELTDDPVVFPVFMGTKEDILKQMRGWIENNKEYLPQG
jgi:hypothetical protein